MKHPLLANLLLSGLIGLVGVAASAETFRITPGKPNLVRFESKAPLESFDGSTRQVQGHVRFDPSNLGESIEVRVEVDLASVDTGIEIRDRHMRENHLETDKHPTAVFTGGQVRDASRSTLAAGQSVEFEIEGVLSLHGVDKTMRAPIKMTLEGSDGGAQLRVHATFRVKLSDHDIARPKFLIMKLDEIQRLTVELVAKAGE